MRVELVSAYIPEEEQSETFANFVGESDVGPFIVERQLVTFMATTSTARDLVTPGTTVIFNVG